ncbi:BZ3500_MvSof-1268-A1-R1_Chr5-2g08054 [Microbotryum saponariae]|uniref:BZ3500_MvSof-1268-A1-R1_Chr5-2g08054 protein n=1 Tax=Microbotryum saponariae TaxID=289078 RepID=A0A2X0M1Z6_9BASI|nr:BZ3500_MvSof-1268-A1-R1_Chr5-2g08054 [Microbotryum saponariae]SDA05923.1 BZ3501_MvSof-1269-A2-R1_Chr5-2g07876 [Microbotryum saponariae]
MSPSQGLFYYPGRLRIPEASIITELVTLYPHELVLLSLSNPGIDPALQGQVGRRRAIQEQEHAIQAASLVINVLSDVEASVVDQVKSSLYSGTSPHIAPPLLTAGCMHSLADPSAGPTIISAVISFYHALDTFPYTTQSKGYLPLSKPPPSPTSSSSSTKTQSSISLEAPIEIAEVHLLPGVLPPDQSENAGVELYKEKDSNVMRFREMIERRVERLSDG